MSYMDEANRAYRVERALRRWSSVWINTPDVARAVEEAILRGDDQGAEELLKTRPGVEDPRILVESVKPEVLRDDKVDRLVTAEVKLEARILRRVASVMRGNFRGAYRSMGGSQDGDSSPAEVDASRPADELEREAREIEDEALEESEEKTTEEKTTEEKTT